VSLTGTKLVGDNPERGRAENDYYATPFNATEALLNAFNESGETLSSDTILEPSAGEGHIVKVLKDFYPYNEIVANDIAYRSSRLGIDVNGGIDFLNYEPHRKFDTIITNPPFALAQEFIEKALELSNHYVIMFAKIQLLEGDKRRKMFDNSPLKYVYVFSKRVNPLRNGEATDENGKPWASTMCFAWFVWEKDYEGEPIVRWL
jgi:predicted RNA methylase